MILTALIALPLTIAASQMFGCIVPAGFLRIQNDVGFVNHVLNRAMIAVEH